LTTPLGFNSSDEGVPLGRSAQNLLCMSQDGHGTKCRRKISENFNRLSTVHERYRQTDDRQADGRQQLANVNVSSPLLKCC